MRLDRYVGDEPKFRVLRRQDDGSYNEVPAFDYFVLALKDINTPPALKAYMNSARTSGDAELAIDIERLMYASAARTDCKKPD